MRRRTLLAAALPATLASPTVFGQAGLVTKFIIPFGNGNATDTGMRILSESLRASTGQNFLVENKPGGGGVVAATAVAKAKPDGMTLLATTAGHITNAVLHTSLPFDAVADFTPITLLTLTRGFVLLVRADSPYKTAQEFIAEARAKPGKISYGSFGVGNTTHVMGALFARSIGATMSHVPYASPINDFLGGHIDCIFIGESSVPPMLKGGRVRALATSWHERSPAIPDVPTFNELGVKNVDVPAWTGILGPKGIPPGTVQTLYGQIQTAARAPEYQNQIKNAGSVLALMSPEEFGKKLADELARFKVLLPPLGIKLE